MSSRSLVLACSLLALLASLCAGGCADDHSSQTMFQNTDCTTCHPASGNLPHSESIFPLTSTTIPFHMNIACTDCHNMRGGLGIHNAHADCTSNCHRQTDASACCPAIEPNHIGRRKNGMSYAWDGTNHDFCLVCHPDGGP